MSYQMKALRREDRIKRSERGEMQGEMEGEVEDEMEGELEGEIESERVKEGEQ